MYYADLTNKKTKVQWTKRAFSVAVQ